MEIIIQNQFFDKSPLSIRLNISDAAQGDQRSFSLSLCKDASETIEVGACQGVLFDSDLNVFAACLEKLVSGQSGNFAPLDPSFLFHGLVGKGTNREILWIIDQGMQDANFSTDTGPGILMSVDQASLSLLAQNLRMLLS